jgi:hypothetical protein
MVIGIWRGRADPDRDYSQLLAINGNLPIATVSGLRAGAVVHRDRGPTQGGPVPT